MAPEFFASRRECRFYTYAVLIKWRSLRPGLPRSELGSLVMPGMFMRQDLQMFVLQLNKCQ